MAATNSREDRIVVRRRFEISADSSFCTVHLINDGITVGENRTTVEFTGTGIAESFLCQLDREAAFLCEYTTREIILSCMHRSLFWSLLHS